MRLFQSRTDAQQDAGSNSFAGLLGSLSLVLATYKPTPILPTNQTGISNVQLPSSSSIQGSSFQVAGTTNNNSSTKQILLPHQDLNATDWGQPSTLYVLNDWAGSAVGGHSLKKTVGPGGCPIQGSYTPHAPLPSSATDFTPFDLERARIMRYRKQISVNLGSWFVLENWMAPSMFSCAKQPAQAEHDFLAGYGHTKQGKHSAKARLEQHWDTWIVKDDFAKMAKLGINTVRIPIGYWFAGGKHWVKGTPFGAWGSVYENEPKYLARAIQWAAEYDIGVLLDLHGAYGSQNGQAHSGVSDGKIEFFTEANLNRTTELLVHLTETYANVTNLIGIEALNEPNRNHRKQLWPWYTSAMNAMRQANNPQAKSMPIFFHDGFSLKEGANFVQKRSDFVVQDNHLYYVYSQSDQSTSAAKHTSQIEGALAQSLGSKSRIARNNLMVGEWSCALAGGSLDGARNAQTAQQNFCNAQANVYRQQAGGWAFWSWRLESCQQNSGWCFQSTVGKSQLLTVPLHSWTQARTVGSSEGGTYTGAKSGSNTRRRNPNQSVPPQDLTLDSLASIGQALNNMTVSVPYATTTNDSDSRRSGRSRGGSAAARAALKVRSTLTQDQQVGNLGYSDGYNSAKTFAAAMRGTREGEEEGPQQHVSLSQMGFAGQYVMDTFQSHVEAGQLTNNDWDLYQSHFEQGLNKGESAISDLVQQHTHTQTTS